MASWANEVAARVRASGARTVGISGPDCAGKSTLAAEVAARLPRAVVVSGDDYTRPYEERHRDPDPALGYYRDSFDYAPLFERLLPGLRARAPETVVIVEGCFIFAGGNAAHFDLKVWIDAPPELVLERALARDAERMGGPDGVRERYARRYLPGQALHVERDDPAGRADLVLRP